ncbi:hypothetical protein COY95_02285 [Candidatus Woesearchaeota archaeon CG_4_10_14_0_8_um_filter_47_5]|nr:MAG: hypothetical protein COY95_02285 [Candidatus Woesearchaeota archaeon CG_4_10_14_0_8_um_filter_47_5]
MGDIFYIDGTKVGRGLFAAREIKKGERILQFIGPLVTGSQEKELDMDKYGKLLGNALQIGKDKYIYLEDPGRIVNHSCNPNAGIKNDVELIAIKAIKKGEEIRYDYSCTMDEDSWTMKCSCTGKNCRKTIKDFKYLPEETKIKYLMLGIVQTFIAKQYEKQRFE